MSEGAIQYYGTGRRKTSAARVYLRPGRGAITVNRKTFDAYFPNEMLKMIIRQPLVISPPSNSANDQSGGTFGRPVRPVPCGTASRVLSSSTTRS